MYYLFVFTGKMDPVHNDAYEIYHNILGKIESITVLYSLFKVLLDMRLKYSLVNVNRILRCTNKYNKFRKYE